MERHLFLDHRYVPDVFHEVKNKYTKVLNARLNNNMNAQKRNEG